MNRWQLSIVLAIALLAGFALAWWLKPAGEVPPEAEAEREILYWVAPMDPTYRRDRPGKSPMGMDLIPVYADGADDPGAEPAIRISPAVINNIGVHTEAVERGRLARNLRGVGRVTPNEHRVSHVHVRTEGWIEQLAVHTEGAHVEEGDILFRFFAPALVSAQDEFIHALASGQAARIDATRRRLMALGLLPVQIDRLQDTREVRRLIEVKAQHSGYVSALNVRHGMFVTPELMVMSTTDLSEVWVDVDVFERQIGWLESGQSARMRLEFAPEREWTGQVDYVYPMLREATRTARVRLAFDNPDLELKPGMYASVTIEAEPRERALHVPTQAVIRTHGGDRVIVALGEGRFRPAEVRVGMESGGRTEILAGLAEGEQIVTNSQFLLDSEASVDASLLRMIGEGEDDA